MFVLSRLAYWCTKRDDRRVSVTSSLTIGLDGRKRERERERERERIREGKSERETNLLKLLLQNIAYIALTCSNCIPEKGRFGFPSRGLKPCGRCVIVAAKDKGAVWECCIFYCHMFAHIQCF